MKPGRLVQLENKICVFEERNSFLVERALVGYRTVTRRQDARKHARWRFGPYFAHFRFRR
jgi:hypothetical protein